MSQKTIDTKQCIIKYCDIIFPVSCIFVQYVCVCSSAHLSILLCSVNLASSFLCPLMPLSLSPSLFSLYALCHLTSSSFSHKDKDTSACVEMLHINAVKSVIAVLCNSQHLSECAKQVSVWMNEAG